jgi:hypothetical protein
LIEREVIAIVESFFISDKELDEIEKAGNLHYPRIHCGDGKVALIISACSGGVYAMLVDEEV